MKLLELYEEIGKILGPEEVGMKILPGIIPMLISGQFTKEDFTSLMTTVRRLLDQIEKYRLPTLPDGATQSSTNEAADIFSGVATSKTSAVNNDPFGSFNKMDKDPLSFLNESKPLQ